MMTLLKMTGGRGKVKEKEREGRETDVIHTEDQARVRGKAWRQARGAAWKRSGERGQQAKEIGYEGEARLKRTR